MSRHLIMLCSEVDRARAYSYIKAAPMGTRIEFKAVKRSLPQNDRMWAMLTDISGQKEHNGRRYTPDAWKVIFLSAIGREVQFIPALDNKTFIPWGPSSSDLSKTEMADLISFMEAWGAENGVTFHGQREFAPIEATA